MYTLQDIKDRYYSDLANGDTERRSLEQYIREEYTPCYDEKLNFLGYESLHNCYII